MKDDEAPGSDLDQMVAMLERSEIDYVEQVDEGGEEENGEVLTILDINDTVRMIFDEDGGLLELNPIPN